MAKRNPLFMKGITKCKRPNMTHHRGRTWDVCDIYLKDGTKIRGHLDTTWGEYAYFELDDQWYKFDMRDADRRGVDVTNINYDFVNQFDFREEKEVSKYDL